MAADGSVVSCGAGGEAVSFTNEAASLKLYAPVHIKGIRNGAGDLTITWIRRTRFSGEWRDLVDVPLNEASEAYVLDGTGAVMRTLSSSSPSVTYTVPQIRRPTSARRRARSISRPTS